MSARIRLPVDGTRRDTLKEGKKHGEGAVFGDHSSKEAFVHVHKPKVEMQPWRYAMLTSSVLLSLAVLTYILFSNIGLAYADDVVSPMFGKVFLMTVGVCVGFCAWANFKLQPIYNRYVISRYGSDEDKKTIEPEKQFVNATESGIK